MYQAIRVIALIGSAALSIYLLNLAIVSLYGG